ncbi:hypothetical protein QJS10_CPB04g01502 [Acorus calamus]|uniref:DUF4283 domain-containing protein n=1 Tax=Acorus calamus TaxID=4465 RepID=A0AAV9F2M4_ACOCL|nr:hypothetical protein QJS10_CPB04g01502 [Acorus calamus]
MEHIQWLDDFDPTTATFEITPVWIRFPNLPLDYWDGLTLAEMASAAGTPIKVETTVEDIGRCRYARALVERCGRIDHIANNCPIKVSSSENISTTGHASPSTSHSGLSNAVFSKLGSSTQQLSQQPLDEDGPWQVVPPRRRPSRNNKGTYSDAPSRQNTSMKAPTKKTSSPTPSRGSPKTDAASTETFTPVVDKGQSAPSFHPATGLSTSRLSGPRPRSSPIVIPPAAQTLIQKPSNLTSPAPPKNSSQAVAIYLVIEDPGQSPWIAAGIYASPQPHLRNSLWEETSDIVKIRLPTLLAGDFNTLLWPSDKKGGHGFRNTPEVQQFRKWVSQNQLQQLVHRGSKFSWCNNRQGRARTWERLD